jgi:hypothetical protein
LASKLGLNLILPLANLMERETHASIPGLMKTSQEFFRAFFTKKPKEIGLANDWRLRRVAAT